MVVIQGLGPEQLLQIAARHRKAGGLELSDDVNESGV
jgi:hypothetical protein